MHQVILRSSIQQMRQSANGQRHFYRALSSTANTTSTSGMTANINIKNNSNAVTMNAKNNSHANHAISSVVKSVTANAGNKSSIAAANVGTISMGNSTSIYPKSSKFARHFVAKSSFSNSAGSSSSNDDEFRSVYVHPLSQVVLEYLQETHHQWVVAKGLDQSLTIHRDGSFELKHTPLSHATVSSPTPTHPYLSSNHKKDQRKSDSGPIISTSTSAITAMEGTSNKETNSKIESKPHVPIDENNNLRVWTSYDEQEKKHWLTVRRGLFRQRFLLQDNLLTAWQANRGISLQERLHIAVDEMIDAVNRSDILHQQATSTGQQQWQQRGQRRFRKR